METAAPQEGVEVGTGDQMEKKKGAISVTLQVPSGCGGHCVSVVCYKYAHLVQRPACMHNLHVRPAACMHNFCIRLHFPHLCPPQ